MSFAALTATVSHVVLFHGSSMLKMWNQTRETVRVQAAGDVHGRLMKNYEAVPQWWFHVLLILMIIES
ncbi:hypothetical protein FRX31_015837 [Thalictrum thalictroides]|uniref:Uncharacterized protein n=1 Tax=Thalictrum thalictroides TaxID=46969 RepID=A0A7J6WAW3_THATH|nr:hypothetical protein FRX31_015837 [Thalictrum thalictroides]